ncbi:nitrogen fixation protein FixH [Microvirga flocculans]|uniref:Nitrogen fixation protein FixH n=1 Tax=Microvirga flocculans TaxID=217168 RepID=A0A7W6IIT7_9HYPH|nr:FixH family protein [Microvirga flocculans]MBB4042218.1 nitrogen fixation protein FixH [Microvirga flocculans]
MSKTATQGRTPKPLTGRTVLIYFLGFFGVVFAMNIYMVRVAVSSFSGVETESAYKAGLSFKNDIAAAQAQDARHWSVEASLQRGEASGVIITARNAQGQALAGLTPEVRLAHPTDKRRDMLLEFVELTPGQFKSLTPMPEGQWDLVIGLRRDTETVFRSKSRVSL